MEKNQMSLEELRSSAMSLEELRSSYEMISKKVTTLWKSGVKSKLMLAKEICRSYFLVAYVGDAEEGLKIHEDFLKGLPFGKSTSEKFKRIGSSKWLYDLDASSLPNDYNTLEALATDKVKNDDVVVEYMKENVTPDTSRSDVPNMVSTALKEEEARKNRSPYEPDPKKDGVIDEYREDGDPLKESSDDGSDSDNDDTDGDKNTKGGVKGTTIITIMVDKDKFDKNRESLMDLVNSVGKITDFVKKVNNGESGLQVETKDKVFVSMLKKIESAETKARNKAYDTYSIRDLAA
jgi:hypothetical protein